MTTYTREQIMQMDTEQLPQAIAEAKGWQFLRYGKITKIGSVKLAATAWFDKYGECVGPVLPHWPTSIADAWKLAEEINTHGYTVNVQIDHTGAVVYITERGTINSDDAIRVVEYGACAPLAISRAYLMWLNEAQHESN